MLKNQLSKNIIKERESRNWSQAELARKINLDNTVVNKIEKGNRKVSSEELQEFAQVFNISMDQLAGNSNVIENDNISWQNLGISCEGNIPDELKNVYHAIAEEYVKIHPEIIQKNRQITSL